jgi:hypothetical protein
MCTRGEREGDRTETSSPSNAGGIGNLGTAGNANVQRCCGCSDMARRLKKKVGRVPSRVKRNHEENEHEKGAELSA